MTASYHLPLLVEGRSWRNEDLPGSGMAVQTLDKRPAAQYSVKHYRQHRQQLTEKGTMKKSHVDSTKENIWGVMRSEHGKGVHYKESMEGRHC